MNDPKIQLRDLLLDEWNTSNTSLSDRPRVHTGWYDYKNPVPQVTITNKEESTVNGGDTGISAGTGTGKPAQHRAGTILVNGWSGTREELRGEGPNDTDINPKQMAYELGKEIVRITLNYDIDDFLSIAPDTVRELADSDAPEIVFREECVIRFVYVRRGE